MYSKVIEYLEESNTRMNTEHPNLNRLPKTTEYKSNDSSTKYSNPGLSNSTCQYFTFAYSCFEIFVR